MLAQQQALAAHALRTAALGVAPEAATTPGITTMPLAGAPVWPGPPMAWAVTQAPSAMLTPFQNTSTLAAAAAPAGAPNGDNGAAFEAKDTGNRTLRRKGNTALPVDMVPFLDAADGSNIAQDGLAVHWQPQLGAAPPFWDHETHTRPALAKLTKPEVVLKPQESRPVDRRSTRQRNDRLGLHAEERKQLQTERNRHTARLAAARRKQETCTLEDLVRSTASSPRTLVG